MNVLYLVTGIRPPAASGSKFIQNLIFEISKNGVNATIISPIYIQTEKNMGDWASEIEKGHNIKLVLIDTPAYIKNRFHLHIAITPFITTAAVLKLLFTQKFDLVHEFTSTPIIMFRALIYKLFGTPSVFTLSVYNKTFLGKLFWFKMFDFGSAYLIPSHEIESKILALGVSRRKIFYLPPGISVASFRDKIDKIKARKNLNLPKEKLIFTYFGPLNKEKGVFDILEASKLLSKETKKKILVLLFSYYLKDYGAYKKGVKKFKKSAPDHVRLYEKHVDIPTLLSASDCVLYPPRTGHGAIIPAISVLETLASQTPIITTNVIGTNELITIANGILVPPASPQGLAAAIEKVTNNLSEITPNNNLEDYDLKNVTKRLLSVYNQVLNK